MCSSRVESVGLWVLEYCPEHEKFPYRLTLTRLGPSPESFTMRKAFESDLADALEPFRAEDEEFSVLPWAGRRPWVKDADGGR